MTEMKDPNQTQTSVRVELKYVRNLGNFESIHVGIGVEDFVRAGEKVDAATDRVYKFVEEKLIEKMTEIEKDLGK